jgi:hypothetical protein
MAVEPVGGTARMRISVPRVSTASKVEAARLAREVVLKLVPEKGCRLSEPEALPEEAEAVAVCSDKDGKGASMLFLTSDPLRACHEVALREGYGSGRVNRRSDCP